MRTFTFTSIFIVALWLFAIIGEVVCIVKAINSDWSNDTSWKREVVYTVSALTGIGAVVGWVNIEDK